MICAGIDYSMTSPAVCVSHEPNIFNIHYMCKQKKMHGSFVLSGNGTTFNLHGSPSITCEPDIARYDTIGEWALDILLRYGRPERIALEDYAFAAKGRVFHIGENTGLLKQKMWSAGLEWVPCEPTRLKAFAGAGKRNTGNSKDLMEARFMEETGLDIRTRFELGPKTKNPISDIIDAYWLCRYSMSL